MHCPLLLRLSFACRCVVFSSAMCVCVHANRNELQQGTAETIAGLRSGDIECLIVTGDNAECGRYVAGLAGVMDPGVPVLLGEAVLPEPPSVAADDRWRRGSRSRRDSDAVDESIEQESPHETDRDAPRIVSWTQLQSDVADGLAAAGGAAAGGGGEGGGTAAYAAGPPMSTAELLGTLATDVDGVDQGKINYALVLTGGAWDILHTQSSGAGGGGGGPATVSSPGVVSPSRRASRASRGQIYDEALALDTLLPHVKVAARFTPTQKEEIVCALAARGRTVAMCGDGGNDCAALRAAHVGLALADGAEASMVSPFSSTERSIRSALDLLLEGRCALSTSFAGYKFLILQGLTLSTAGIAGAYYGVYTHTNKTNRQKDMSLSCSYKGTLTYHDKRL